MRKNSGILGSIARSTKRKATNAAIKTVHDTLFGESKRPRRKRK